MNIVNKYTLKCHSCVPSENDAYRMILQTENCIGVLRTDYHGSRGWIGRSVFYTKGHLDPIEALKVSEERTRCNRIHFIACQRLLRAIRGNYAEAGNKNIDELGNPTSDELYHHPHTHIIPRYKERTVWREKVFIDHTFLKPMDLSPNPSDEEIALNEINKVNTALTREEITLLKTDLQKELVKMIFDVAVPDVFKPKWVEIERAYPAEEVIELYNRMQTIS